MGRKATGSVWFDPAKRHWFAIITKPDKSRKWVAMADMTDPNDRETAKRMAAVISQRWRERGCVDADAPDTLNEYFTRWAKAREERGIETADDDRGRYRKWIGEALGTRPVVDITPRDLESFVARLDVRVRAGELAWKTAIHVWGLLTKLFDDAHRAKDLTLRIRKDNPARDVRGPDRGDDKASFFLFPSELATLLACDVIPLERLVAYTLAVYTGMRAGELRALAWADVHEDEGFISVHHAVSRKTGALKSTKTGLSRKVPIEPELLPLLAELRDRAKIAQVLSASLPRPNRLAAFLRADLRRAGVNRAELYEDTATTRQLDFHDLRHTYGTWRAIRGDDVIKIRFAMGHTDLATTQRYINEAHVFDGKGFGVPFGPLPESLVKRCGQRLNLQIRRENLSGTRDSKAHADSASAITVPAENKADARPTPSAEAVQSVGAPSLETLRAKLDAAIVAEAWDAVKAIRARIVEIERDGVIDLERERTRRRGG